MKHEVGAVVLAAIAGYFLVVGVFAAPIAFQTAAEGTFELEFDVTGAVELEVSTGSGDVTVRRGGNGSVQVAGTIHVSRRADDPAGALRSIQATPPIEQNGNRIVIGRNSDEDRELMRNVSISYEITVPADTGLQTRSGSGDQDIMDVAGPVEVTSGSGDIEFSNIDGDVEARTGSGDITAERIAGSLQSQTGSGEIEVEQSGPGDVAISTGSGDIEARDIRGGLSASSGSGDIEVDGEPTDDWSVSASSGGITLDLPAQFGFDLDAETSSGSISMDQPITNQNTRRNRLSGQVNGGGVQIRLRTSSGSIRIR